MNIALAETEADIARCYPVMAELRPHLAGQDFVALVRRQQQTGYLLAYLEDDGEVRSVAGYRYLEMLCCGKILYVDDLVTHADLPLRRLRQPPVRLARGTGARGGLP